MSTKKSSSASVKDAKVTETTEKPVETIVLAPAGDGPEFYNPDAGDGPMIAGPSSSVFPEDANQAPQGDDDPLPYSANQVLEDDK